MGQVSNVNESVETPASSVQNLAMVIGIARDRLNADGFACAVESLKILSDAAKVDPRVFVEAIK